MYTNQDFSQAPPFNYNQNSNYIPNYEMQGQIDYNYPSSLGTPSANMNYTYFNPPSNYTDEEESATVMLLKMRERDEKMIEDFLTENEQKHEEKKENSLDRSSKISEARCTLVSICRLNNELKELRDELKENPDMPEADWYEKIKATVNKRDEINGYLIKLEDDEYMSKVKLCLEKRKKKRLREKKQRTSQKIVKQAATERRIKLHAEVDAWIKDKQDIIEREKRDFNMRKDADIVLAEVRERRSDARKFLAMLQELQNLRKIRVTVARARGEHLSAAADQAFANIIDKLVEQWSAMDREYSIEEQGLKLMLKTENEEKIKKQKKTIFEDWENVLFGRKLPAVDSFQRNINAFVAIRAAWDKYINNNGLGSPIPIGWVMPAPPSSEPWQKFLKKE
ncbi:programmed cell death protein 7 [Athalia rosae]|uniref:programmed cell death protein 7 n=1 Tax=Athalia rosae TaxID=37344 RepID=UPI002034056F|nr:programmed cell death protein 7 [Athalia rosae]